MLLSLIQELGGWSWWILGLILLGMEIMAPGTFFLWFGLSAMVVGTVTLALGPDVSFWSWQVQVLIFVALSLTSAVIGRKIMQKNGWDESENPNLNSRGTQLIGRTVFLKDAISGGQGRAKIGDTIWRVSGPDLEKGSKVRIVAYDNGILSVEADG
ncbi:MAG: NfeD family protein [Rhizobiaceae bacterium]|nr:NfeD family protein [Rhizobiaceae bacterium]